MVHEVVGEDDEGGTTGEAGDGDAVAIGQPEGTMTVGVDIESATGAETATVRSVTVGGTQRRLMDGTAYYRP